MEEWKDNRDMTRVGDSVRILWQRKIIFGGSLPLFPTIGTREGSLLGSGEEQRELSNTSPH